MVVEFGESDSYQGIASAVPSAQQSRTALAAESNHGNPQGLKPKRRSATSWHA